MVHNRCVKVGDSQTHSLESIVSRLSSNYFVIPIIEFLLLW